MKRRIVAAAAMLAAAVSGAADCPPARLRIAIPSAKPRQGAIFPVTVRSETPIARGTLTDGRLEIPLSVSEDGRTLRALVGIDFESAPGPRTLKVEAVGACGKTHRASSRVQVVSGRFRIQSLRVDPAYVEPPESERERIRLDREKVARVWASADTERRWRGPFGKPVPASAPGDFGAKRVFNGESRSRHNGVDLAAPEGADVLAPAPGVVALAEELYFSGGTVILDHGSGLFTTYFHLSAIDLPPGSEVAAGRRIGAVGATGRATGPHLHWGARLHGARVNPLDLLRLPAAPTAD